MDMLDRVAGSVSRQGVGPGEDYSSDDRFCHHPSTGKSWKVRYTPGICLTFHNSLMMSSVYLLVSRVCVAQLESALDTFTRAMTFKLRVVMTSWQSHVAHEDPAGARMSLSQHFSFLVSTYPPA